MQQVRGRAKEGPNPVGKIMIAKCVIRQGSRNSILLWKQKLRGDIFSVPPQRWAEAGWSLPHCWNWSRAFPMGWRARMQPARMATPAFLTETSFSQDNCGKIKLWWYLLRSCRFELGALLCEICSPCKAKFVDYEAQCLKSTRIVSFITSDTSKL